MSSNRHHASEPTPQSNESPRLTSDEARLVVEAIAAIEKEEAESQGTCSPTGDHPNASHGNSS